MQRLVLFLMTLVFAGCATTVRYSPYTQQKLAPKPSAYTIMVYPSQPTAPLAQPYTVIGKVSVSGRLSHGVTGDELVEKAKALARKKGADAIINAKSENFNYTGTYTIPEEVTIHPVHLQSRHRDTVLYMEHYRPAQHLPYNDTLFTFNGELIAINGRSQ